jgi:hypothetical protein
MIEKKVRLVKIVSLILLFLIVLVGVWDAFYLARQKEQESRQFQKYFGFAYPGKTSDQAIFLRIMRRLHEMRDAILINNEKIVALDARMRAFDTPEKRDAYMQVLGQRDRLAHERIDLFEEQKNACRAAKSVIEYSQSWSDRSSALVVVCPGRF